MEPHLLLWFHGLGHWWRGLHDWCGGFDDPLRDQCLLLPWGQRLFGRHTDTDQHLTCQTTCSAKGQRKNRPCPLSRVLRPAVGWPLSSMSWSHFSVSSLPLTTAVGSTQSHLTDTKPLSISFPSKYDPSYRASDNRIWPANVLYLPMTPPLRSDHC